jgi:asparagine synthase (glutamine-hydrolysing)
MSVIFGIRNRDGQVIEELEMTQFACLTERYAPDGTSLHVHGDLAMGFQAYHTHTRSQLETQPLSNDHGNVLAFDGRLDNYRDLCGLLGISVHESPDSLIILKAFEHWGEDCFLQFIGDWSLSLWVAETKTLYLARDHAGSRTLYFEDDGGRILWSTYLDMFLPSKSTRKLDEQFAISYLACQPTGEQTSYKGIRAVPPAHFLKFKPDLALSVAFWQPSFRDKILYRSDAEYERHFFSLFRQAVARRSDPSDRVIAQLSGGMDSTAIVSMSDHIRGENGAALEQLIDTVSFYDDSEPNWNEKPYFTAVERKRGKPGIHIATSSLSRTLDLPDPAYALPGVDGGALAAEVALEESIGSGRYRAILSGIGGDELLGGPVNPVPELADYLVRGKLGLFLSKGVDWCLSERASITHLLPSIVLSTSRLYWPPRGTDLHLAPWLTPKAKSILPLQEAPGLASLRLLPSSIDTARTWSTIHDTQPHCFPGVHVRYEYRYPLLDRDLVEFLLRLPPNQIRRPGNRRSLMRRALAQLIIPEVLERKRKAFPARGASQFIAEHRAAIDALFRGSQLGALGFVDEGRLHTLLGQGMGALSMWTRFLMRTIELELWLRSRAISIPQRTLSHSISTQGELAAVVNLERKFSTTR